MTPTGLLEIAVFFLVLLALTKPLGAYMARVYQGERTWLDPVLVPVERAIYRASGIDWRQEQSWRGYTAAMHAAVQPVRPAADLRHPEDAGVTGVQSAGPLRR